ncbi:TetR/AcrR family transcriptional regulator [uncultured Roseibium sp.]|uniref:TetR/AcrR family transcriptional regulator n=1 Tax=uncultured Roseibium sp. TaxID=1936171 RepID=UPI0026294C9A|nr:TetR/AcrR family transcriptional regulator [uncultured Roseibium sp.]
MAGRPKSFDMDKALDAFVDVFWTKGYQGTSVDDLQDAAGIKRGSFYAAFGCKDDVFEAVLAKYWREATELGLRSLETEKDPLKAVAQLIRHVGTFMTENTPRGCLLLTSSSSLKFSEAGNDAAAVRERMKTLETRIINTLTRQDCNVQTDRAHEIAAFTLSSLLGLNALARNGQNREKILAAADYSAKCVEADPG